MPGLSQKVWSLHCPEQSSPCGASSPGWIGRIWSRPCGRSLSCRARRMGRRCFGNWNSPFWRFVLNPCVRFSDSFLVSLLEKIKSSISARSTGKKRYCLDFEFRFQNPNIIYSVQLFADKGNYWEEPLTWIFFTWNRKSKLFLQVYRWHFGF